MVFFQTVPILGLGGHTLRMFFEYQADSTPVATEGAWLDDLRLECYAPVTAHLSYEFLDGTSMAAPHVTGAAALLFSLKPSATVTEVRNALLGSVHPTASLAGKTTTGGRLDIVAALKALVPVGQETVAPETELLSQPASDDDDPLGQLRIPAHRRRRRRLRMQARRRLLQSLLQRSQIQRSGRGPTQTPGARHRPRRPRRPDPGQRQLDDGRPDARTAGRRNRRSDGRRSDGDGGSNRARTPRGTAASGLQGPGARRQDPGAGQIRPRGSGLHPRQRRQAEAEERPEAAEARRQVLDAGRGQLAPAALVNLKLGPKPRKRHHY